MRNAEVGMRSGRQSRKQKAESRKQNYSNGITQRRRDAKGILRTDVTQVGLPSLGRLVAWFRASPLRLTLAAAG
jgi:hypothetical protein